MLSYLFTEYDDVRLVGGTSHCNGILEMKHKAEWRPVDVPFWIQMSSAIVCRQLNCGSLVTTEKKFGPKNPRVLMIRPYCSGSESSLTDCAIKWTEHSSDRVEVICSGKKQKQKV